MCRWLAYSGAPIFLEDLIFLPEHSLIDQSLAARAAETTTNGDGFGIGWYGSRDEPGVYRDIQPAWNDLNLRDLAAQIKSPLFFAHVRAATSGSPVQQSNCHPFRHGRFLFMHNGKIRGFDELRRDLMLEVEPALFNRIRGSTDTELMFHLALTYGLEEDPVAGVARMVGLVERLAAEKGVQRPMQMTLAVSQGARTWAFRYSSDRNSNSLYYSRSMASLYELNPQLEHFSRDARAVVSEPLTDLGDYWEPVPDSSVVVVDSGEIENLPFEPSSA